MPESSLKGRWVVLTRSEEKSGELRRSLENRGAKVLVVPVIRHVPAWNDTVVERVVEERLTFSHLAFASQTAVSFFFEASRRHKTDARAWSTVRIAAVGPRTAREIQREGLDPFLVSDGGGATLAQEMIEKEGPGRLKRVLLPQSNLARLDLKAGLEVCGVNVESLTVYKTLPGDSSSVEPLLGRLRAGQEPAAVHFASPSAVSGFLELCGEAGRRWLLSREACVLAIGPTTAQALCAAGITVAGETGTGSAEETAQRFEEILR